MTQVSAVRMAELGGKAADAEFASNSAPLRMYVEFSTMRRLIFFTLSPATGPPYSLHCLDKSGHDVQCKAGVRYLQEILLDVSVCQYFICVLEVFEIYCSHLGGIVVLYTSIVPHTC